MRDMEMDGVAILLPWKIRCSTTMKYHYKKHWTNHIKKLIISVYLTIVTSLLSKTWTRASKKGMFKGQEGRLQGARKACSACLKGLVLDRVKAPVDRTGKHSLHDREGGQGRQSMRWQGKRRQSNKGNSNDGWVGEVREWIKRRQSNRGNNNNRWNERGKSNLKRRQNNRGNSCNGWNGWEKGSLKKKQNNSIYLCELFGCTKKCANLRNKDEDYIWDNKQEKRWRVPSLTEFTDEQNWQRSCTEP